MPFGRDINFKTMILRYTAGNKGNLSEIGERLSKLQDGEWTIEVTKNRPIKSLSSLRYLFGVVYKEIANVTGYDAEQVHEMMKYKFLSKVVEFPNGVHAVAMGTTKEMDVAEMALFTERVKEWAKKYLDLKFVDQRDVDYSKWSEIRSQYDSTFNRVEIE